jgi:hypothetical protein
MFLNKIIYNQKNFLKSQENFLLDMAPYMLTPDVWEKISSNTVTQELSKNETGLTVVKNSTFTHNAIFWCIYTAINGEIMSRVKMPNIMINEKRTISDYFNNNSAFLKNSNHKLTLAKINEIKCNLMTKLCMDSVESFIPLSIYYKRPIYVYFKEINSYMKFVDKNYVCDDECNIDPNIILISAKVGKVELETDIANFIKTKDTLFYIHHYEKILPGVSTFKTDEIREIYKTVFGKDDDLKKPEYYEKVLVKCHTTINAKSLFL